MKIRNLFIVLSLVIFTFVGCGGNDEGKSDKGGQQDEISLVKFKVKSLGSKHEVSLVPDFEKKVLSVHFIEEALELDAEAEIGDDYFIRFEQIIAIFEDVKEPVDPELWSGHENDLALDVFYGDFKDTSNVHSHYEKEDAEMMQLYFDDIQSLFKENKY